MPFDVQYPTPSRRLVALSMVAALAAGLSGCGETYINDEATATTANEVVVTTTLPPVPDNASVDELLRELDDQLDGLSESIIDKDDTKPTKARINEIWEVLHPKLRDDPTTSTNVAIAVDYANLAVDRSRPADADKAVKVITDVIADRA